MKLAVLFWFYKDISICKNRLEFLRHYNPEACIYGLYGGNEEDFSKFEQELSPFLDDLYPFTKTKDPYWKWINGDLMINDWYCNRGHSLDWDTIFVATWDLLVFGNISNLFPKLKKNEILLGGVRPLEKVESHWWWVQPKAQDDYKKYIEFKEFIQNKFNHNVPILVFHNIVTCFPRLFLDQYSKIDQPELGTVEYRLPTYVNLFKIPLYKTNKFESWWACAPNAKKVPWTKRILIPGPTFSISIIVILYNLFRKNGGRIFHPFLYIFPNEPKNIIPFLFNQQRLLDLKQHQINVEVFLINTSTKIKNFLKRGGH